MRGLQALSQDLAALVAAASPAVVGLDGGGRSTCSALHWEGGYLLTVEHGLRSGDRVPVLLPDRTLGFARVIGRDASIDLALLHTTDGRMPSLPAADPAALAAGHVLVTVGRGRDAAAVAAFGMVASHGGAWQTAPGGTLERRLRVDVLLPPALEGGPAMTAEGAWAGLITGGLSSSGVFLIDAATVLARATRMRAAAAT